VWVLSTYRYKSRMISVVKILIGHIASHRVIVGVVVARVDLQLNMGSSFLHIIIHTG